MSVYYAHCKCFGRKSIQQQRLTIRKTAPSRTVFMRTSISIGTASQSV